MKESIIWAKNIAIVSTNRRKTIIFLRKILSLKKKPMEKNFQRKREKDNLPVCFVNFFTILFKRIRRVPGLLLHSLKKNSTCFIFICPIPFHIITVCLHPLQQPVSECESC